MTVLQWVLGIFTVATSLMVVTSKNPVVSAVMLMGTLFLTGALYFGLGSFFIGAVQVLIYAGAISVLFVFIVMLLDLKPFYLRIPGRALTTGLATVAGLLVAAALLISVLPGAGLENSLSTTTEPIITAAGARDISLRFLSKYMLPYEVTGLLILVAIMGVVVLGRPRRDVGVGGAVESLVEED